jgi:hypothetical protein
MIDCDGFGDLIQFWRPREDERPRPFKFYQRGKHWGKGKGTCADDASFQRLAARADVGPSRCPNPAPSPSPVGRPHPSPAAQRRVVLEPPVLVRAAAGHRRSRLRCREGTETDEVRDVAQDADGETENTGESYLLPVASRERAATASTGGESARTRKER